MIMNIINGLDPDISDALLAKRSAWLPVIDVIVNHDNLEILFEYYGI